jgi:hypothetical protein
MAPHAVDLFHSVVGLPFLVGFEGLERLERLLRPIGFVARFMEHVFDVVHCWTIWEIENRWPTIAIENIS